MMTALSSPSAAQRPIGRWLFVCATMILIMAVIGAVTRLTESGLSIVEWKPIHGVIPPLSQAEWQEEFDRYRQYPEYQKINRGMSLAEFKQIFWWEYIHRIWGRLIGVVFAVPFLWFLVRGQVRGGLAWRLSGLFLLGGLQGAIGWWMVKSGLVDRPDVSHYRLAVHLMMAALLFSLCLWQGLTLYAPAVPQGTRTTQRLALALLVAAAVTMTWGAFVAGLNAGMVYNTFPLMGGGIVPPDLLHLTPWWQNFLEHHGSVQWLHRVLALLTCMITVAYWLYARRITALRTCAALLLWVMLAQIGLGIATLLLMVPISLAALHQANGFIMLGLAGANLRLARCCPSGVPAPGGAHSADGGGQGQSRLAPV